MQSDEKTPQQGSDDRTAKPAQARTEQNTSDDGEFQLTVKKLEVSVRPRGVLAE